MDRLVKSAEVDLVAGAASGTLFAPTPRAAVQQGHLPERLGATDGVHPRVQALDDVAGAYLPAKPG